MKNLLHNDELYTKAYDTKIYPQEIEHYFANIAKLLSQTSCPTKVTTTYQGRNLLTRTIDRITNIVRTYFPTAHQILITLSAFLLFIYAKILVSTCKFVYIDEKKWLKLPTPSVLTVWHGSIPSLIVALAAFKTSLPIIIMVSPDPRGDFLTKFCNLLNLHVVRGISKEGGWSALKELVCKLKQGALVVITPDGGGPAEVVKIGAIALASATNLPLVAIGADCSPAIAEVHKWDKARNPIPFGRIAIKVGDIAHFPNFTDLTSLNNACLWLENALNNATKAAKISLKE